MHTSHAITRLRLLLLLLLITALSVVFLCMFVTAAHGRSFDHPSTQTAPNTPVVEFCNTISVSSTVSIDPTTVSARSLSIHSTFQGLLGSTFTVNNSAVLIVPDRPFFAGDIIQGTFTTDIYASTGQPFSVPVVWQLRTAASGSGNFTNRPSGMNSTWSEDIAVGDLDSDGDLDIFLGHRDDASTIALNDGSGSFSLTGIDLSTDFLIDIVLADLDSDGDLDAILAGIQDNRLLLNNGQGVFQDGGEVFANSSIIVAVAIGDVDGDGDLDAVTAVKGDPFDPSPSHSQRVWLNNGIGDLQPSGQSLGAGTANDIALGDLDGDGDLDGIVVSSNSSVWRNLGNGVFASIQTLDDLNADSVELGDLDGDGDLDAFVGANNFGSAVWLNDGSGMLAAGQSLGSLGPSVLGDLDGDGDLDAFSANWGPDKAWLNNGDATFVFTGQSLGDADSTGAALGDLDGDGDIDVVTSGYDVKPNLWINQNQDGNGTPTDAECSYYVGIEPYLVNTQIYLPVVRNSTDAESPHGEIAFLVGALDRSSSEIYTMNSSGSNVTKLTEGIQIVGVPVWSPDGSKIAFENQQGYPDIEIFVANADGSNRINVTNHPALDANPSWSHDGSKLVFERWGQDPNDFFAVELYTVNADGSDPKKLTDNGQMDYLPSWSPDGSKIAFEVFTADNKAAIHVMNADGTNIKKVTDDTYGEPDERYWVLWQGEPPAWSPDSSRIAFVSNDSGNTEIYAVGVDGKGLTNLTKDPAVDKRPRWSPDGSKIAFVSDRIGGLPEIYVMAFDGSGLMQLTNNSAIDSFPTWSTDGSKIAFDSDSDGSRRIYLMNADGSGQKRISSTAYPVATFPVWSPR